MGSGVRGSIPTAQDQRGGTEPDLHQHLRLAGRADAGGEWDASKYSTFLPDADGILPITDEENLDFFATLSSEEFILFAFSYTESCRCSINVLN